MDQHEVTQVVHEVQALVEARYVYPSVGAQVARVLATGLADGRYPAGKYTFSFDGTRFSSGEYFYRLTAGNFWATKAMILLK